MCIDITYNVTQYSCFDQGQMTAEERNARPNEYGELSSKDFVPGAQVCICIYFKLYLMKAIDITRACQWNFLYLH